MERMNELLEKYFRGETNLAEEKELKQYFAGDNIKPEHEVYQALFGAFNQELSEKANAPLKKVLPRQQTVKRIWIKTFAYSGVAAAILLAVWIQRPHEQETYAVIGGNKIENTEYAQKYAEEKLNKVNKILRNSMKPMQSLETVRKGLEPIQKLEETREKLNEIENKIQFK
jgi:hypothetical protein